MTIAGTHFLDRAAALMREAEQVVDDSNDALVCATAALIRCAREAVEAVISHDAGAARDALASARAAVVVATYATRALADCTSGE